MKRVSSWSALVVCALSVVAGCSKPEAPVSKPAAPPATPGPAAPQTSSSSGEPKHAAHGAGPHEGAVADWGGGKFHVEFTVDHDKQEATVYILGDDERTPAPIKAKDEEILLSISEPSFQVTLKAAPQDGDPEGTASRFVGKDEKLGVVQEFAGTISGEVEGTPYTGDFKEEPHQDETK